MENKHPLSKGNTENQRTHQAQPLTPLVDIYENEGEILLQAELPGVSKEEISINIDNGKLTLAGTRKLNRSGAIAWEEFGNATYQRSFSVPQTIDVTKVSAELKEGVLWLHLPKSEAAKPRPIEIKAG